MSKPKKREKPPNKATEMTCLMVTAHQKATAICKLDVFRLRPFFFGRRHWCGRTFLHLRPLQEGETAE